MKPSERRRARRLAVQAIYSWQLSGNNIADVEHEFLTEQNIDGVDVATSVNCSPERQPKRLNWTS